MFCLVTRWLVAVEIVQVWLKDATIPRR